MSRHHRIRLLSLAVVLTLVSGMVTAAFAQDDDNPPAPKAKNLDLSKGTHPDLHSPYGATGQVTLLVEYKAKPAAQVYAEKRDAGSSADAADAAASEAVKTNTRQQAAARAGLNRLGAITLYDVQRVLNASVVRVDANKVRDVMALPGVARVSYAPRHIVDNADSVPFIGSNQVWDSTGALGSLGLTGEGITIAVIDTGVDYVHANFGGDGDYTGDDPTVINSDGIAFPTSKVVAGYDFVGDDYDAASDNPARIVPHPDPDPIDCNGHGSHTAGTSGGFGVAGGTTYTGGYDNLTDFSGFEVGPGVAPEASIVALKVFGCDGSTDVVVQAIEYATDPNGDGKFNDHFDVINMSLGSSYGFTGEENAITNATKAGVIVVASSGNSSDTHYITGSPGSVTEAISVAASIGGNQYSLTLDWDDNNNGSVDQSFFAIPQGWAPIPSSSTPLTLLEMPSGDDLGCDPGDFAGFTPGNVAYIFRGTCAIKLKAYNAQAAGASAAVIVAHNTNVPVAAADDPTVPAVTIPAIMISGSAGDIIEDPSFGGDAASINPAGAPLVDQMAGFSSRGPRRENLTGRMLLKPDISAPGFNIVSTASGTGNGGVAESGTSMAAPHIAGVMALLRQAHPTWKVAQLKALVMNTAVHDLFDTNLTTGAPEERLATSRIGNGRVDVALAASDGVIAYDSALPAAVSVTFQTRDVLEGTTDSETRSVTIENKGSTTATYNLSIDPLEVTPGVTFSVSPATVTVKPNKKVTVKVTADYDASAMIHHLDPGSLEDQDGNPRHWITEATGYLVLDGDTDLRLALYAAPRPASAMSETTDSGVVYTGADSGSVSIPLVGTQVENWDATTTPLSGYITRYRSRVSAFELAYTSPHGDPLEGVGKAELWDGGDIQYVGVASDVPLGGGTSFFATSMWGDWDTPSLREVYVCLDLDHDGTGGVWGDGTDWCFVTVTNSETDSHMTGLWDINGFAGQGEGAFFSGWDFQNQASALYDTRIFDNSVFFMPAETSPAAYAAYIVDTTTGGTDTDEAFNYFVYTFDYNDPGALAEIPTDATPLLSYDPTTASIHHTSGAYTAFGAVAPIIADFDATAFNFDYDFTADPDGKVSLLFLHHYNMPGDRAHVVTVDKAVGPPCTGLINCDFESADSKNRPTDWKGKFKTGDVLVTSPVVSGSKAWQFSGKGNGRSLYQEVALSGISGDGYDVTFYVDGTQLGTKDKVTVLVTFYNGKKAKKVTAFDVTNAMDFSGMQTYHVTAPTDYTKIRVTLTASLKTTTSKATFDVFSLVASP